MRVGHDPDSLGYSDAVGDLERHGRGYQLAAARARGLVVWARQEAIAAFVADHRSIAVAGTTGKTTTTSISDSGEQREAFAVIKVAGVERLMIVPVDHIIVE